jgi:hypothetical protein
MERVEITLEKTTRRVKSITVDGKEVKKGGININLVKSSSRSSAERVGCEMGFNEDDELTFLFELAHEGNLNVREAPFTPKEIVIKTED